LCLSQSDILLPISYSGAVSEAIDMWIPTALREEGRHHINPHPKSAAHSSLGVLLMNIKSFSLAMFAAAAFAVPALAHHSFSMFDAEKTVTLNGTVKELEWTNPHSWLRVMVEDATTHQPRQWSIELASTGQQTRIGWTKYSL